MNVLPSAKGRALVATSRRISFFLAFLLVLKGGLNVSPVSAEQRDPLSPLSPMTFETELDEGDDTALFVVGNTLFAVYHELGHALVDLLDLPIVGREEDAVDGFAAVMMIPPEPDPVRDELIIAVADGWRLQSERSEIMGGSPLWAEHALDEQRFFSVICWMVGSDQEGFFDLALEAGMPEERIDSCALDFERVKEGWQDLLHDHRRQPADNDQALKPRLDVAFEEPAREDAEAFEWARMGDVIERSVLDFGRRINLPETVTVRFASCGEANAYWYGKHRDVVICYGLVDDFLAILNN